MKLSRKLLPALAMLLVSAVMMSTASFAWFSTNTTATANGMNVTVASATNLMISSAENGSYASTYAVTKSIDKLVPTSTVPGATPAFFYMKEAGDNMVANKFEYGTDSKFEGATADTHYIKATVYLKAIGENVAGGSITPEILLTLTADGVTNAATKTDSPVYPAFRVLVVYNTTALLYAPVEGADAKYTPIAGVTTNTPTLAEDEVDSYNTNNVDELITNVAAETPYKVDIYLWLEGQDSNCTAANDISLEQLNFAVNFNFAAATGT